jgi:hypothetical protein
VAIRIISPLNLIKLRKEARANLKHQSKRTSQATQSKAQQQQRNSIKCSKKKITRSIRLINKLNLKKLVRLRIKLLMTKCNKMMLSLALTLIKKMSR